MMVGIGTLLALLGVAYIATWILRRRLPESAWFYRSLVAAAPLSVVALIAGWIVTEVGRQPWVVYRVMPTAAAVTVARGIPVGYAALAASYLVVGIGLAWVLRRLARRPLDLPSELSTGSGAL
jgi:cytochrome d ubiquinol oxidase subunit I